jgi:hypothetical protein
VGILALIIIGVWWSRSPTAVDKPLPRPPATNEMAAKPEPRPLYEKLVGKWVRPDGGYVLEIRSADNSGKVDAGYFNPNPIHVARAEASGQGSTVAVFVELRDVNYPGSTYRLAYDSAADLLKGYYYQAVSQETYEIFFERLK